MKNIFLKNKNIKGYMLLELIFYLAFLSVLTVAVTNSLLVMTKALRETIVLTEFAQAGSIMETMSRYSKQAVGMTCASSQDCTFKAPDSSTVEFVFSSPNILFYNGAAPAINLNTSKINVTGLTFTTIPAKSTVVSIVLSVQSVDDAQNRTQTFNDTSVLRGSYASIN
jgi:Tfp pilus assembly protein PilE